MSHQEADLLERSARELSRVDELFHLYVAPQLATTLERQPERARLGGDEREVSVLFADLAGFTGFSEERPASEAVEMLNRYWAAAVPAVVGGGGLIDRFAGDAIIVVFNAVTDQPDHAMRAARAALAIRSDTEHLAAEHASWPRFGSRVNTGPAVVGSPGASPDWQSGPCHRIGRDATGRTTDPMRRAAMLQDSTRQPGPVSLLLPVE